MTVTAGELAQGLAKLDPELPVMYREEAWLVDASHPEIVSVGTRHNSYVTVDPGDELFKAVLL